MLDRPSRKQVLAVAALAALFVAAVAVLSPQGLAQYRRLSNEAARLAEQNEALRQENARKRAEVEALKTSRAYQEKVVREDLGYVRPGEKLYIVETGNNGADASSSSGAGQRRASAPP